MKEASETISESVRYLGQSFLLAYYLPALVFISAHLYVLIPNIAEDLYSSQREGNKLAIPLIGEIDFSLWVDLLLWSFIVGIILFILNNTLIRTFEGKPSWLKNGLLFYFTRRNRKKCKTLYGRLTLLRNKYFEVNGQIDGEEMLKISRDSLLDSLRLEIENEHKNLERNQPQQNLPHNVERVCPTLFGNVYAIAEEYPYERYGIDSVLFWPHLRALIHEKSPNLFLRLAQQKTILDLSINFSFLSGLLAVEAIFILIFSSYSSLLSLVAGLTFVLSISFYQASLTAIQGLGELIKVSFDYYRNFVLQAFNLRTPENLSEEQAVWIKLATFIRRGDAFYFPEQYRNLNS